MLIMTYAYARASGNGSLISKYVCQDSIFMLMGPDVLLQYSVLISWANYLSASTLFIGNQ